VLAVVPPALSARPPATAAPVRRKVSQFVLGVCRMRSVPNGCQQEADSVAATCRRYDFQLVHPARTALRRQVAPLPS
jgi:hypothetical protein